MRSACQFGLLILCLLPQTACQPTPTRPAAEPSTTSASSPDVAELASLDYSKNEVSHHDDSGRVEVQVGSAWSDDQQLVIRARFTPDDPGFHLYSSELPREGVSGLGRPTLVEVDDDEVFSVDGPLVCDQEAHDHVDDAGTG